MYRSSYDDYFFVEHSAASLDIPRSSLQTKKSMRLNLDLVSRTPASSLLGECGTLILLEKLTLTEFARRHFHFNARSDITWFL